MPTEALQATQQPQPKIPTLAVIAEQLRRSAANEELPPAFQQLAAQMASLAFVVNQEIRRLSRDKANQEDLKKLGKGVGQMAKGLAPLLQELQAQEAAAQELQAQEAAAQELQAQAAEAEAPAGPPPSLEEIAIAEGQGGPPPSLEELALMNAQKAPVQELPLPPLAPPAPAPARPPALLRAPPRVRQRNGSGQAGSGS